MGTNRDHLDGVTVFTRVVEKGSFTLAAGLLGIRPRISARRSVGWSGA